MNGIKNFLCNFSAFSMMRFMEKRTKDTSIVVPNLEPRLLAYNIDSILISKRR
jgi:hypothetical protein